MPKDTTKLRNRKRTNRAKKDITHTKVAQPFPDITNVDLNYVYYGILGNSASTELIHRFRINSLFDPDVTYVGKQPLGYDQWSSFYSRYFVDSCHIEVQATCNTNTPLLLVFSYQVDDAYNTIDAVISNPYSEFRVVSANTAGPAVANYSSKMSVSKLYGTKVSSNLDEFVGLTGNSGTGNNPPNTGYFTFYALTMNGTAPPIGSVHYCVKIVYHSQFLRRIDLAMS